MSLVCGIVALVLHLTFCGCGSFLAAPVAVLGLSAALFARGGRLPLVVLNGLALLICAVELVFFLLWMASQG